MREQKLRGLRAINQNLKDCRRAYGMDCVIFARSQDIVVNYEILD